LNGEFKFLGEFGEASSREQVGREISAAGASAAAGDSAGAVASASTVVSSAAVGTTSLRTSGAASEKESTSTNSFSEPDGQLSRKLNRGQKETPFRLSASTKASSSKEDGTRRTPMEETFLTAFFNFLRLIRARPEAA
jgi:hypothetical protein